MFSILKAASIYRDGFKSNVELRFGASFGLVVMVTIISIPVMILSLMEIIAATKVADTTDGKVFDMKDAGRNQYQ